MLTVFIVLAGIGFAISLYSFVVEQNIKKDPTYKPACDLSERISCSKPMKSEYSSLFFFSNSIAAMLYYALIAVLAYMDAGMLLVVASIASFIVTCVLAYILYVKIQSFCLVCSSLYVINTLILVLALTQLL